MFLAKEFQKNFKAGLRFCGVKDGKLEWLGTDKEWQAVVDEHEMCTHCGEYAAVDEKGEPLKDWDGKPMCKFCRDIELETVPVISYNMIK